MKIWSTLVFSFCCCLLCCLSIRQDFFKREWQELVALSFVKFTLKLDPVQSESVQESWQALHKKQDSHGEHTPSSENSPENNEAITFSSGRALTQHHAPQHLRQLYLTEEVNWKWKCFSLNDTSSKKYKPAWAKLRAHRRKYDAVWEIQPKKYSIVWIHCSTATSPSSN